MRLLWRWMVVPLMSAALLAQTATQPKTATPAKRKAARTSTTKAKTAAAQPSAATQEDVRELRDAIAAQQRQIQQLRDEIARRDQQIQQAQRAATEASSQASAASAAASVQTDLKSQVATLSTTVNDLRANNQSVADTIQTEQKRIGALESPASITYKGITITPGGFIEAAGVFRTRNENASVNSATAVANVPLSGSANSHLTEFRGDMRQSRLTLLAEGKVGAMKMSGYYEVDFLGAAPTANEVESNSWNLRQRQIWGQAEFDNGTTFSAGQMFSLITTTRRGQALRAEFLPTTIDAQYNVGYNWARQLSARVVQNFHNKMWLAFSVENSETNLAPGATTTAAASAASPAGLNPGISVLGLNVSPNATSPSGLIVLNNTPGANGVSTDLAPDLLAKAVFEPGWGHYELKLLGRAFRDRVQSTATTTGNNITSYGGGIGAGFVLPVVAKKVDLIAQGLVGNGIGRYGSGVGPDVTVRPDGKLIPIRGYQALIGPEIHPTPNLDIFAYYGEEYYARTAFKNVFGSPVGYGSQLLNISNCAAPDSTACAAQTRYAYQIQPGFWYRFYRGPKGTLQWGLTYAYTYRKTYQGLNGSALTSTTFTPLGIENTVMTSFRYYLP